MPTNKCVVLGVTGGISAYKMVDVARKLMQAGITVDVVMTEAATEFVTPLTFQTLAQRPVITEMFQTLSDMHAGHISLSERADLIVVAPATANTIAKLAHGIADNLLTSTILATNAPILVVPAMNFNMYENVATQDNLKLLRERGFLVLDPEYGAMASGAVGRGRLPEVETILGAIKMVLGRQGDLQGYRLLVTAGGTQEPIDPVRYISNRSSGKMGYALAEAARDRGADVALVSTPVAQNAPFGVQLVNVETALEMKQAVEREIAEADALIMAAAVADYRVESPSAEKIKKDDDSLTLRLVRNPDILAELPPSEMVKVGFAAESADLVANAQRKLSAKQLDLIVANSIVGAEGAFGSDYNKVWVVGPGDQVEELPKLTKREVAERILDRVAALLRSREH